MVDYGSFTWPPAGSGGGSGSNASVSTNNGAIPGSSTLIAGTASGTQTPVKVASDGTVQVAGSLSVTAASDTTTTGTITANGQTVQISQAAGSSSWSIQLSGTFSAGSTVTWEVSDDGATWIAVNGRQTGTGVGVAIVVTTASGPGPLTFRGNLAGTTYFRVRCTAFQAGDLIAVAVHASTGVGAIFLNSAIPSGINVIGKVGIDQTTPGTTNAVAVTNFPGTQPVSGSVSVSNFPSTQTILPTAAVVATGTLSAAGILFTQDCSLYQSASIHITAIPAGNVATFQISNDNVNWYNCAAMPGGDLTGILATTATAAGSYTTQLNSRYFRVNLTTYTSGTVSVTSYFKNFGNSPNSIGGYVSALNLDGAGNAIGSTAGALNVAPTVGVLPGDLTTSGTITTQNLVPAGTATAGSTVGITLNGQSTVTFSTFGTYTTPLTPQVSMDGVNWTAVGALYRQSNSVVQGLVGTAQQDTFTASVAGFNMFRVSANGALTGSVVITLRASQAPAGVFVENVVAVSQGGNGTLASSWYTRISDGTTAVPVKAASTAAVATDPALVVAISPNNTVTTANKATTGTFTDKSGTTSATPSTSTTLAAINATRKYLFIQNISTSATIWINFTSAATAGSGSIELLPLASYALESSFITTELVTVLSTTASVAYSAKEGN